MHSLGNGGDFHYTYTPLILLRQGREGEREKQGEQNNYDFGVILFRLLWFWDGDYVNPLTTLRGVTKDLSMSCRNASFIASPRLEMMG